MVGPALPHTLDRSLRGRRRPAHQILKRVRSGRDDGPPGPIRPLQRRRLHAEHAQRGERVPEVAREVEERRGRVGELDEREALEPRRVPPQEAREHARELRAGAEVPQVRVPQRGRVPRVQRERREGAERVVQVEQLELRQRDRLRGRGVHVDEEERAEAGECGGEPGEWEEHGGAEGGGDGERLERGVGVFGGCAHQIVEWVVPPHGGLEQPEGVGPQGRLIRGAFENVGRPGEDGVDQLL